MNDAEFLNTATLSCPCAVVNLYHKGCLNCNENASEIMRDKFAHFQAFFSVRKDNCRLNYRRTELSPEYHKRASELYGNEQYPPIVEIIFSQGDATGAIHQRCKSITLDDFVSRIKEGATLASLTA